MESETQQHQTNVQIILAPPEEVYAATDATLKIRVSCVEKCDLQNGRIRISDGEGNVVQESGLISFDGEANATDEFTLKMPAEPGPYRWAALFVPHESEQVRHEQNSATFHFSVRPHQIHVSAWDIPSPVTKGERFAIRVGAKCSAGCSIAGLPFAIEDHNHRQVTTGKLGEVVLPQTSSTYWSEQELVAPSEEGLYKWSASVIVSDLQLQHEVNAKQFAFFVTDAPDHIVTVEVVAKSKETPLQNASVFMNRRRASTDEFGRASLEVAKGTHKLYVSIDHYAPFETIVDVDSDVAVRAELIFDPDQYTI